MPQFPLPKPVNRKLVLKHSNHTNHMSNKGENNIRAMQRQLIFLINCYLIFQPLSELHSLFPNNNLLLSQDFAKSFVK